MSGRVTRRRLVVKYSYKVGAYRMCGSFCKCCKCACDGVKPTNALARSRGAQSSRSKRKKIKATQQIPSRCSKRTKVASNGLKTQQESKYNDDDNTSNNEQLEVYTPSMKSISRMKKAYNKEKQKAVSQKRKTMNSNKDKNILETKNSVEKRKNNRSTSTRNNKILEVTALPYNLRGIEEVSVCNGSLDALEKNPN